MPPPPPPRARRAPPALLALLLLLARRAAAAPGDDRVLSTLGNKIMWPDGTQFFGRGVNVMDTRGCVACVADQNADEVIRRIDFAVRTMGATLLRLNMEAYAPSEMSSPCVPDCDINAAYLADINKILAHVGEAYPRVQVMLSAWASITAWQQTELGWPTNTTNAMWARVVEAVGQHTFVWFGVVNEPESNFDGAADPDVWTAMNDAVAAIRQAEVAKGFRPHIVSVQGTRAWARTLDYYIKNPITAGAGANIVYETHAYNPASDFQGLVFTPAATLPVVIGELGPVEGYMTLAEAKKLMKQASAAGVPWLAWALHMRCPPNILVDKSKWGCGIGMKLKLTKWGAAVKKALRA